MLTFSPVTFRQQASLCFSLLSATVPLGRTLFKRFETGNVVLNATGTYSAQKSNMSGSRSRTQKSQQFDSLKSGGSNFRGRDRATFSTAVYHEDDGRTERVGSQDMIIWRQDEVTVDHE